MHIDTLDERAMRLPVPPHAKHAIYVLCHYSFVDKWGLAVRRHGTGSGVPFLLHHRLRGRLCMYHIRGAIIVRWQGANRCATLQSSPAGNYRHIHFCILLFWRYVLFDSIVPCIIAIESYEVCFAYEDKSCHKATTRENVLCGSIIFASHRWENRALNKYVQNRMYNL